MCSLCKQKVEYHFSNSKDENLENHCHSLPFHCFTGNAGTSEHLHISLMG
uniref:Uncharacterized protein n=1 Tax=Anguilla anguilla TaxID=7936 RepID=A0A0E9QMQ5_ANGAN